jgi:hypothetical protein|tara:strand:+ start:171 stop:2987 length:2817 start_codon:yes stop_codon:yes gene_type:complete
MFAAGGNVSKFPDLSGDGQVTQKDILMGRGVIERQAGGPVPEMAPTPAPIPPEMEGQINAVEEQAAMGGEQAGLEYLAGTMEGIDAAQSFEEVINAMRGNQAPMQERRMELAGFVGDEDAFRTPDSVVAMVQPTIMLTEEGAMDSGIGQLMQALSDDVAMMGPEGQPTPVGQGVGELLMQGQPEPMPPMPQEMMAAGGPVIKKFAAGGAVQKFANGMGVNKMAGTGLERLYEMSPGMFKAIEGELDPQTLDALYPERLALYKEIYGDDDDERQRGFDLAQAGFALASGIDPSTGQNIAGRPFLSQVGSALTPLAQRQSERLSDQRKGERALRLAAMQSAEAEERRQKEELSQERQAIFGAVTQSGAQERDIDAALERMKRTQLFVTSEREGSQAFNLAMQDDRQAFESEAMDKRNQYTRDLARLNADLQSALSTQDFNEAKKINDQLNFIRRGQMNLAHDIRLAEIGQLHDNAMTMQADQFGRRGGLIELQGRVNLGLQENAQDFKKLMQDDQQRFLSLEKGLDRELSADQFDASLELKEDYLDLAAEEFAYKQALGPETLTSDSWWASFFRPAGVPEDQAQVLQNLNQRRRELENQMLNMNINLEPFKVRAATHLQQQEMMLRSEMAKSKQFMDMMGLYQSMGDRPIESSGDLLSILVDPRNIQAYGEGKYVKGMDMAIGQFLNPRTDPVTKESVLPLIPSDLAAAVRQRQEAGVAVPLGFMELLDRQFQVGGEVEAPEYLEPLSGTMLPGPTKRVPLEEYFQYDPIITGDTSDITQATGTRSGVLRRVAKLGEGIQNLVTGSDFEYTPQVNQAVSQVNALATLATVAMLGSIPGKDNVQLQTMVKELQVPGGELFLEDRPALEYFKTARRVVDFGIRQQELSIKTANLSRKEETKANIDLAHMKGIRSEYDNIIRAYENKLAPSQEFKEDLDQFFN